MSQSPDALSVFKDRLIALLERLTSDWAPIDETEGVALYLLCGAGLAQLRFTGRAWTSQSAIDFEATVCGVWIDAERKSILPDEIRRAVPAWAGLAVSVQLTPPILARLTAHGQNIQRELRTEDPTLILEYICASPIRGRVAVRLLGNEGPAPGAVGADRVLGEMVKTLLCETARNPLTVALSNASEIGKALADALADNAQARSSIVDAPRDKGKSEPVDNAEVPEGDVDETELLRAVRCVVGKKKDVPGMSRLIDIRRSDGSVNAKLGLMEKTGLLAPNVSAAVLADFLRTSPTAVKKTPWWKERMAQRREEKADADAAYYRKRKGQDGGGSYW